MIWLLGLALLSQDEHQHHHHPEPPPGMVMTEHAEGPPPQARPAFRHASGTSWQPDSTPVRGVHLMPGDWRVMIHWLLFAGFDAQGSDRGDSKVISIGWGMAMAQHELLGGKLGLRAMLTLEPLTVGRDGYPLLLQTGEEVDGRPLHDRQHPHDLFMELAVIYDRWLSDHIGIEFYGAPVGEPALGPTAFPHRYSASADPLAVLSHHWQDSTHISFGVVTAGVFTRRVKLEGSWFNGREPDADRYDFDFRGFDSASGRVSWNPDDDTSLQVSYGYLGSPEELEPDTSQQRITASVTYNRPLGLGNWASTLAWGRDVPSRGDATDGVLLESLVELGPHSLFGRAEYVRKSGADLALPPALEMDTFPLGSLVLGYLFDVPALGPLRAGLGVRGALDFIGADLEPYYGTRTPVGGMVFLRLIPTILAGHHHH